MPNDLLNASHNRLSQTEPPIPASSDPSLGVPVTEAEIDAILNDPTLSAGDRKARLDDLRERMIDQEGEGYAGEYTTFETRIMDAFSMVAEGGHDYARPLEHAEAGDVEDPFPAAKSGRTQDPAARQTTRASASAIVAEGSPSR